MPETPDSIAHHCPLCGGDNRCAAARDPSTCWCMDVVIDPATLQALPAAERGQRCLCQACATGQDSERREAETKIAMAGNRGDSL